jgi:short-subunit dehydrogenase
MKKYTLITGSSSGIGFELAKNISQYSNVILHGSRDYNKIEKLRLQLIQSESSCDSNASRCSISRSQGNNR